MMLYAFESEEVTCCTDCPLEDTEFGGCLLEYDNRHNRERTTPQDGYRPKWCKLIEMED